MPTFGSGPRARDATDTTCVTCRRKHEQKPHSEAALPHSRRPNRHRHVGRFVGGGGALRFADAGDPCVNWWARQDLNLQPDRYEREMTPNPSSPNLIIIEV